MGRFITKPMTRDEACKILNVEEQPELNHKEVLEVSSFFFEKHLRISNPPPTILIA